jgi:hypothetical protein
VIGSALVECLANAPDGDVPAAARDFLAPIRTALDLVAGARAA